LTDTKVTREMPRLCADGHVTQSHLASPEGSSTPAVMKTRIAQFARAIAQPNEEILFDESLYSAAHLDLKNIQRLSHFLPVLVLVPKSTPANQVAPHTISATEPSSERSGTAKPRGVIGKAVKLFAAISSESMFTFDDVTINFPAMEVLRKGKPVVFTTLEFKTLKYFIENTRRVISRDELLNEVWGYENYPTTRTVDNYILRLRQKLESDPSRPAHFRTVHGAGYKFLP
jgi:DNA-binding response OmpR family regulator